MASRTIATQVLIVGGGPVGLTLAMELLARGIQVAVAERRPAGEPPSVKCNHVSARSIEIYRRLGLARSLRDAGLPSDFPNDIAYRISTTSVVPELARIPILCRRDRYTATGGPDTWWPTPDPPHRINQLYLEPPLFAHAAQLPQVTIINCISVEGFTQTDTGVSALARDLKSGETFNIEARYLVGCDGASSSMRKAIGANLLGTPVIQSVQSTYIRSPDLLALMGRPAWMTLSLRSGSTISDGAMSGISA
jgi:2-polyprenyl-6-methoxyphenol hydroxylase-like FAD-dependent oxidoreductase